jgi:hypothetical protein
MSLAVVKDIQKYSHANNQGEILFSKTGLLARKSVMQFSIDKDDLNLTYYSFNYFEFKFSCSKFNYFININDNYLGTDDWSQVGGTPIHNGFYAFNPSPYDFNTADFTRVLVASILGQYFDIYSTDIDSRYAVFTLTAKDASADYNLILTSRDKAGIAFIDDTAVYKQALTLYQGGNLPNYKLHMRILVEDEHTKDTYHPVYENYQTTGEIDGGRTLFSFKEVLFTLRSHLSFHAIQDPFRILTDKDILKKYKVEYWESWDTAITTARQFIVDSKYVLASGYDELKSHLSNDPIRNINNSGPTQYIAPGQPAWVSFMIREEDSAIMENCTIVYTTNLGTVIRDLTDVYTYRHSNTVHIPIHLILDTDEDIDWVDVRLELSETSSPNGTFINYQKRFNIDKKYFAIDKWYYYLNSLGGIDTIRLYGDSEDSLTYNSSDYEVIRDSGEILSGGFTNRYSSHTSAKTKGLSGWIDRVQVDQFQDFVNSKFIYEIDQTLLPKANMLNELPIQNKFSTRHNLEQLQSHRVNVISKELATPKGSDGLVGFKVDIERAYVDAGIVHSSNYTRLPKLQEDVFEFSVVNNQVNKAWFQLTIEAKCANLDVYIHGVKQEPGTNGVGFNDNYGYKSHQFIVTTKSTSIDIVVKMNYAREFRAVLVDSFEGKIMIHKARFNDIRKFRLESGAYNKMIENAGIVYLHNWRTIQNIYLANISETDAINLLLAINEFYYSNPYEKFQTINLSAAGLTPSATNILPELTASLTAKGVIVTI